MMEYQDVLHFWFEELEPKQWWVKDDAVDATIRERFFATHTAAAGGELAAWREAPTGRLAEVIVLDQFSRNLFRGTAEAFAYDAQALTLAEEAIANNAYLALTTLQCSFLYMPFMHSESAATHEKAVKLFSEPGMESNLEFELKHKAIIDRFGRYPHRNAALGRESTPEELEFLKQPGSSF